MPVSDDDTLTKRDLRRWWASWPLRARIAGSAVVALAVAGLAVAAWGVLRTEGDREGTGVECPPGTEIPDEVTALHVTIQSVKTDQLAALRSDLEEPREIQLNVKCYTTILSGGERIELDGVRPGDSVEAMIAVDPQGPYDVVTLRLSEKQRGDDSLLSPKELYDRVEQAITRPGLVLHSTIEVRTQDEDGTVSGDPDAILELWIDASNERMRYTLNSVAECQFSDCAEAFTALLAGDSVYSRTDDGEITESEAPPNLCPGTDRLVLSTLLLCDEQSPGSNVDARAESNGEYEGESSLVLVVEESYETTLPGGPLPPPTMGTVPPTEPARSFETRNTSRIQLAVDSFLPIVRTYEIRLDGEFHDASAWVYEHEFVSLEDLGADFFDPESLPGAAGGSPAGTPAAPPSLTPATPVASSAR